MKKIFSLRNFTILCLFLSFSGAGMAQDFKEICSADLNKYCSSVTPGDGRVTSCLYAHSDRLTEGCFAATEIIGRVTEGFFDGVTMTYEACASDIQKQCAHGQAGSGKIVMCLMTNSENVSEACLDNLVKLRGVMQLNLMAPE